MLEVNMWAVLVCGVVSMVTGFLWYGPLFGNSWAKEMGFDMNNPETKAKMQKMAGPAYFQQFIGALLMAYVFAHILSAFNFSLGTEGAVTNLQGAFWSWLGFIVPVKYGDKLWGGKSIKLFFIDSLYYLLNLLLFAVILGLWV